MSSDKVGMFDRDGQFMCLATVEAAEAAVKRKEAVKIADDKYQLRDGTDYMAVHELTPQEKRRLALAKEREKKGNR